MMENKNYSKILSQIAEAATVAGRKPEEVRLVGVTKYFTGTEEVEALYAAGCRDFAENRLQVFQEKADKLRTLHDTEETAFRWHFIGPLQKNKARKILQNADVIHSGESLDVLQALDRISAELNLRREILVEINLGGEQNKHGFSPAEFRAAFPEIQVFTHLKIVGLMGMTSLDADETQAHRQFATLRQLRDEFLPGGELSMGMSDDFPIAIVEGATMVRIGSALFE
ncbi:MAG: YggS family pyridoxal phosphate-dependent enzyme [Planctomycetia bacterium]|nr:YggS family pyridoxal phosphate-dependent enzyme [Planctomycetia bacterium]